MGSLSLKSICKSFGPVEVLKGVDLEVRDGELDLYDDLDSAILAYEQALKITQEPVE